MNVFHSALGLLLFDIPPFPWLQTALNKTLQEAAKEYELELELE